MNSNKHYITAFCIPYNIYSYSCVIIVTVYQTCPKSLRYREKRKLCFYFNIKNYFVMGLVLESVFLFFIFKMVMCYFLKEKKIIIILLANSV